jgi:hypothetical protein
MPLGATSVPHLFEVPTVSDSNNMADMRTSKMGATLLTIGLRHWQKCLQGFGGQRKKRNRLENLGLQRRVMLKYILNK